MSWFNRQKHEEKDPLEYLPEEHKASIEIVAHKNAHAEAKAQVDEANALLTKIFKDNHFSLTLYLAAGGQVKQKQKGQN